jgi:hypothetical protein
MRDRLQACLTAMPYRLFLGALLFIGTQSGHATVAQFTTGVDSTANQFSAGTVHIADSLASGATLSMANLVVGDSFDAELTIANSGTLDLVYALTTLTTGDATLANTLQLTVRTRTSNPCASRDGAVLYSGDLAHAVVGDPQRGVQPGDRTLSAGSSEALCFTVVLPSSTDPALQGASVAASFRFDAEQS